MATRRVVFCPFHGRPIALAACHIVATSEQYNAARGALTEAARNDRDDQPRGIAGRRLAQLSDEEALAKQSDEPERPTGPRQVTVRARRLGAGSKVCSDVDRAERIVLATAGELLVRKKFSANTLRAPRDIAEEAGAESRPARACPVCKHPLPLSLDDRDVFPITMIGHSGASKTSTIMALIEEAGRRSEAELGVHSFFPTGSATDYLWSRADDPKSKPRGFMMSRRVRHPPLEFVLQRSTTSRQLSLLFQDAAGEDLTDHEAILRKAPSVLWSDVIIYVYDPTKSTKHAGREAMPQAAILNRVREDIEHHGRNEERGRPHLIVMVSKADTLDKHRQYDLDGRRYSDSDVQDTLRELGDGGVVAAAKRFETVRWLFASPSRPDTETPQGIVELFRTLLQSLPLE
jgi:hypothetical protein